MTVDIDELVREAQELRDKLANAVVKLEGFAEQLQSNVDRLRVISDEMKNGENRR